MNKYLAAIFFVCGAQLSFANEWIAVGTQPTLAEIKSLEFKALEMKLWNFLTANSKSLSWPKESYRFQYQSIGESILFINALCITTPNSNKDMSVFPEPSLEELKKDFYHVKDGGNCFFNVKYNIKNGTFSSLHINGDA